RALAKDPAERYASASDMANDLAAARSRLDPAPSHSKPLSLNSSLSSGLSRRASKPNRAVKRSRTQVVVAASAGVGFVVAPLGIVVALKARASNTQVPVVTTAPVTSAAPVTNTPTPAPAAQTVVPAPPSPSRSTESTAVAKTPEKPPRQQAKSDTPSPSAEE